jgi:hypothetical protein
MSWQILLRFEQISGVTVMLAAIVPASIGVPGITLIFPLSPNRIPTPTTFEPAPAVNGTNPVLFRVWSWACRRCRV